MRSQSSKRNGSIRDINAVLLGTRRFQSEESVASGPEEL